MNAPGRWRSEALNMAAAAMLALLIWAYANDRTRETASVAGTVRISPADPRAQFVDPSAGIPVAVEVRGSRRAIEAVEDALRSGLSLPAGATGVPATPGPHEAPLREVLSAHPTVAATGVEVVRVRPESLRYEAGVLVTEQVPVTVALPNASVRGAIVPDPPVVAVTMPEAAAKSLGSLAVDAAVDTKNLEPGKPQQVDVELRIPESLARWKELVRVVPPRAKVSFELLATGGECSAPPIPVRVALPPESASRWDVMPERGSESVSGITLSGPRAGLDAVLAGSFMPAAVVDLGDSPVRIGTYEYPVSYWRLPEGVTVVRPAGNAPPPSVRLRIMPRVPAPADPPR